MLNFESMRNQARKVLLLGILSFLILLEPHNYHRLGGVQKQKLIISHFRRPEVRSQYHMARIKVTAGPVHTGGQNRFLDCPASSGCWLSLTYSLITPVSAYVVTLAPLLLSVSNLPQSLLQGYLRLTA